MAAFFVASVTIRDAEKFTEYAQKAAATFAAHGGEIVLRGKAEVALAGALSHGSVGIVKFPDMEALGRWFRSSEYQALIPMRDEAADMSITAYAAPN